MRHNCAALAIEQRAFGPSRSWKLKPASAISAAPSQPAASRARPIALTHVPKMNPRQAAICVRIGPTPEMPPEGHRSSELSAKEPVRRSFASRAGNDGRRMVHRWSLLYGAGRQEVGGRGAAAGAVFRKLHARRCGGARGSERKNEEEQ